MKLKRGAEVQVRQVSGELWTCSILGRTKDKNYHVEWITGPLRGREARLSHEELKR
jgi:hypothetical protein